MAKIISISTVTGKYIHWPRTRDDLVLYTRTEHASDDEDSYNLSKRQNSDYYKANCDKSFNSATNIKRIWFTHSRVIVEYHTNPIINKNSGAAIVSHNIVEDGKSLYQIAEEIAMYDENIHRYQGEKAINSMATKPTEYRINGKFNICSSPYVCSNIEEIYFDWSILMSEDVLPYFANILGVSSQAELAYKFNQGNGGDLGKSASDAMIRMFVDHNSGGAKNIANRFPRLREIAMISNLDNIVNELAPSSDTLYKMSPNRKNEKSGVSYDTWIKSNMNLIVNSGSYIINWRTERQNPNTEFIVKSSTYKFDFDKLDAYVKQYTTKVNEIARNNKYKNIDTLEDDLDDITQVELRLNEIQEKYGEGTMIAVWQYAYSCSSVQTEDFRRVLRYISREKRNKLANAIGIKI